MGNGDQQLGLNQSRKQLLPVRTSRSKEREKESKTQKGELGGKTLRREISLATGALPYVSKKREAGMK